MSITSYAQNFEDVILWRLVKDTTPGSYIDVGAQHPIIDSVSNLFYEKGWRGISVEPNQEYANLLRVQRPDEIVIQAVVSEQAGLITFYQIPGGGLSTVRKDIAESHRANLHCAILENIVTAVTLDDLFALPLTKPVHWLKIDVEGYEREVLAGWRESNTRPWVVVIEATYPCTTIDTSAHWEEIILDKGYELVYQDGLNRFYLHHSQNIRKNIFRFPPNVFDEFQLSGTATSLTSALAYRHQEELSHLQIHIEQSERQIQHLNAELEKWTKTQELTNRAPNNATTQLAQIEDKSVKEYLEIFHHESHSLIEQLEKVRTDGQLRIDECRLIYEIREKNLQTELAELRQQLEVERLHVQFAELQREIQQSAANVVAEQLRAATDRWQKDLHECERQITEQLVGLRTENQLAIELSRNSKEQEMRLQSEIAALSQRFEDHCVWASAREDELRQQAEKERQDLQSVATQLTEQLRAESYQWQKSFHECQRYYADQFVKLRADERSRTNERRLVDAARIEKLLLEAQTEFFKLSKTVNQHSAYIELISRDIETRRDNWWRRLTAYWLRIPKRRLDDLVPTDTSMNKVRADLQRTVEDNIIDSVPLATSDSINKKLKETLINEIAQSWTPMKNEPDMHVKNITELFALDGSEFIFETYRNLLLREPDKHGLAYYLGRLAMGYDKESVVAQIARSDDCRPHNEIKGLQELVANEERARHWLFGLLIRRSKRDKKLQTLSLILSRIEKDLDFLRDTRHSRRQTLEGRYMFGENSHNVSATETHVAEKNSELSQMKNTIDSVLMRIKIRHPWTESKLLNLDDEEFVKELYRAVLHREPDIGGKSFFLSELQEGRSKKDILRHLIECDEAKDQPDNFVYLNTKLELLIAAVDGLWNRIASTEKRKA